MEGCDYDHTSHCAWRDDALGRRPRRWNAEIGPIYPKTPEAALAPLRRIDLRDPVPDDLTLARPVVFTPTFVLIAAGTEVNRIEGYPGPDFFWGLLDSMFADAGSEVIN